MSFPLVFLWSHPRSLSTAFERSFRARGDFHCFHEPFMYYYYLGSVHAPFAHFDADPRHPTRYHDIRAMLFDAAATRPVFVKDMAYYVADDIANDNVLLQRATHTFLIRHPARSIASYFRLDPTFSDEEVGVNALARLYDAAAKTTKRAMPVVDADDLQANPAAMLSAYCRAVGIPFLRSALEWEPTPPADWAPVLTWHKAVAESSGFRVVTANREEEPDKAQLLQGAVHLTDYYDAHIDSFKRLKGLCLRPDRMT